MAAIMEQDERMQAMQNNQNAMLQLFLAMQTRQQEYDKRNERRVARLTEEMAALTVRMDGFQDYIYHVAMPHPPGTRGRARGRGRGRDNEQE